MKASMHIPNRSRWAVFLSGRGSTAQAFWDLLGEIDCVLCVSNNPKSLGLLKARRMGIATYNLKMDENKKIDWSAVSEELNRRNVSHIFLLGFMRLLPVDFLKSYEGRIFNLHPSLLPEYAGAKAIERSYENGKTMGVSVHHVIAEMDAGDIITQRQIYSECRQVSFEEAKIQISITEQNLLRRVALAKNHLLERPNYEWS